jgi:hypothetical protein
MYQGNKERAFELEQNIRQDEEQTQRENQHDLARIEAEQFGSELKEAWRYINYGVKEGFFEPDEFEGLEDKEIIERVNKFKDLGDYYADQQRKGE